MIIMINGAFGTGKSTVAEQLYQLLPDSMIYDPEQVGYMLGQLIPAAVQLPHEQTGDFQDMDLWRSLVVQVAQSLYSQYQRHLIVPMTLCDEQNFSFIRHGFEMIDRSTYHYCLRASRSVIHERLLARGEEQGNWCFRQTDRCLAAYESGDFGEYIDTDTLSAAEIALYIYSKVTAKSG